jgi:hypothetical protein
MRAGQYYSCNLAIGFREGARHLVSGKAPRKGKFFVGLMAGAALFAVLTQPATAQPRGQEPTCKNAAVSARISALYLRIARYENRLGASFQHSWFSGTIGGDPVKTQLNTALVTLNYMITPRF